jgi:hypothetical protein
VSLHRAFVVTLNGLVVVALTLQDLGLRARNEPVLLRVSHCYSKELVNVRVSGWRGIRRLVGDRYRGKAVSRYRCISHGVRAQLKVSYYVSYCSQATERLGGNAAWKAWDVSTYAAGLLPFVVS